MMGQQHNTHIANSTELVVKVVLTDTNGRNTSKIIPSGKYVCIPTPHGRVSVTAFRLTDKESGPKPEAAYTDDSDRSFIIKMVEGKLDFVRSKYGSIWQEDSGLR